MTAETMHQTKKVMMQYEVRMNAGPPVDRVAPEPTKRLVTPMSIYVGPIVIPARHPSKQMGARAEGHSPCADRAAQGNHLSMSALQPTLRGFISVVKQVCGDNGLGY